MVMLSRSVLCRLTTGVPKTSPHAHNASHSLAIRALPRAYAHVLSVRRSYATTITTTAKAGRPSGTVKKSVKEAAAKKPAPKRKTASTVTTSNTKTAVAKKAATKPKAKKRKAAPKKTVRKKRVKKELTAEQKQKALVRSLKLKALKPPKSSTISGYQAYLLDKHSKGADTKANTLEEGRVVLGEIAKQWATLPPAQHEHYNHMALELTATRKAAYQAWIKSHSPETIRVANIARHRLKRLHAESGTKTKRYPPNTEKLFDDRIPKVVTSAYAVFTKERWESGDLKGIPVSEAAKLLGQEWNALSSADKAKYKPT